MSKEGPAPALPSLRETISTHGLLARKSLGQHFLLDEHITGKIAAQAGKIDDCTVIEIGPGPGGLTRALLAAGAREVFAVEKDSRCIAALAELETHYPKRLRVLEEDALETDLCAQTQAPRRIVANLPYNVGTLLLVKWLGDVYRDAQAYRSLTLMFQREVANRILADPGSKDYGRVSVLAQWLCHIIHHFDLPPGAFVPPPSIHSSVITLVPRPAPEHEARLDAMEKVVAAAFGQRRKMLRQSLKALGVPVDRLLEIAGIDGSLRGEVLGVAEFARLARVFSQS